MLSSILSLFKSFFTSNLSGFWGTKFFAGIILTALSFFAYNYYDLYNLNKKNEDKIIELKVEKAKNSNDFENKINEIYNNFNNDNLLKIEKEKNEQLKKTIENKEKQNEILLDNNKKQQKIIQNLENYKNEDINDSCLNKKVDEKFKQKIMESIKNENK